MCPVLLPERFILVGAQALSRELSDDQSFCLRVSHYAPSAPQAAHGRAVSPDLVNQFNCYSYMKIV